MGHMDKEDALCVCQLTLTAVVEAEEVVAGIKERVELEMLEVAADQATVTKREQFG